MQHRREDNANERAHAHPRSSRFVETEAGWYFVTREGIRVGPYASEFDAELAASLLITQLSQLDEQRYAKVEIHRFLSSASDLVQPKEKAASSAPVRPQFALKPLVKKLRRLHKLYKKQQSALSRQTMPKVRYPLTK